ncbi:bifunctional helix-turn-helix transcriptional regulator/GNAT family N-acetyltransferase [Sneathiella limimaris]|uniref:bifunctional helix-turn-helix transcriptional regulator/GNAT family N-acetyltransferase n=1 Tax=Sneathiella limimaris TaxID=1964213 RepID=UPI00146E8A87|nr:bifunctional helix-turn-helix transcriptional regulator/GNAT family N-acetyltransferase [Sneathiella limimaris]
MTGNTLASRSAYMRHFTRFYTQKAGVLNEVLLDSAYGLTEARLIYEMAVRQTCSAKELSADLELDPGYISRCLKKMQKLGLIQKSPACEDRRQMNITLTDRGQSEFNNLDQKSSALFGNLLKDLSDAQQATLLEAMGTIETLLKGSRSPSDPVIIRPHRPGDLGWIVSAHGRLYFEEYGWNTDFEAMVAEIAAEFLNNYKPGREICWIAERAGQNLGSAVVVEEDEKTAKLRLVILDRPARGTGIGKRLVEECLNFARSVGYERMNLWTNANLHAAIAIYEKLGFEKISEEPHHSYGKDLVGQFWTKDL